ncbi:MAG TPA: tectonin domain-containing protein, partial [Gemmatimonadaceae bacterium]|nr:tectonin domain-containing protein [Gemmatimonadaceae bacterium]
MKILRSCLMMGFVPLFTLSAQAPASWTPVGSASVSDLAVNANGDLWAVALDPRASADKPVLKWTGREFIPQSVSAKRVAVDPQGNPWIVTSTGTLLHWTSKWNETPLKAVDVAVGANGAVWAIGTDSRISRLVNGTWKAVSGAAVRISVDPQGNPWVVNAGGQIWRWLGTDWQLLPGSAQDISISPDGSVFIVGTKRVTGGYEIQQWNGKSWTIVPGPGGAVIAAGRSLYIALHGTNGSLVHATTYHPIGTPTTTATTATPTTITLKAEPIAVPTPATGTVTIAPPKPISIATPAVIQPSPSPQTTGVTTNPPASSTVTIAVAQPTVSIPVTGITPTGTVTTGTSAGTASGPLVVRGGLMPPLAAPVPGTLICPILNGQRLEK